MKVWRWPLVTAALGIVGLASALFYDGWGDAVSWIGLGLPVAQSVWFWKLRGKGA
jgi:hypothetical protein